MCKDRCYSLTSPTNVLGLTAVPLLNMGCMFPGAGFVNFRVSDVTNLGGSLCSSYQLFVLVLKKTISLKANISLYFEL